LVAVLVCVLFAPSVALADKSRKVGTAAKTTSKAEVAVRSGMPITGAMETALPLLERAQSRRAGVQVHDNDSIRSELKITFVNVTSDVLTARVSTTRDEPQVDLYVVNMLGKRVADIYRGTMREGLQTYTLPVADLPEGMYVCIFTGNGQRKAEKFFISR
jgi:hypothetical protein